MAAPSNLLGISHSGDDHDILRSKRLSSAGWYKSRSTGRAATRWRLDYTRTLDTTSGNLPHRHGRQPSNAIAADILFRNEA
jgi:hypothetical protein